MEEIKNWEEFEKKLISEEKQRTENFKNEVKKRGHRLSVTDPLFRGQADEMWSLSTTLERFYQERGQNLQEFSTKEYFGILKKINHGVSSNYGLPEKCEDKGMGAPAGYDLMAHLRHHRFPSPLLDWTVSPYIAAYFAFRDPNITNDAAIYVFRETVGQGKISDGEMSPNIWVPGPYVCTHPRHHKQQAQ